MGQVWRAVDRRLRRPVAVKVLPPEIAVAEGGLARFEREAEVTAALQHPGITVVFDIGQDDDGLTYLVMELLEGEDLRAVIDRHPDGLPVDRAVGFALQLADALAAAHSRGIVHRDIKPANLFVLAGDRLKLCDFGIASLADGATRLTREGGTSSNRVKPPWTEAFEVQKFTYLSVIGNSGADGGAVRCSITLDGKVIQERSATGQFASVACQYAPVLHGGP